MDRVDPVDMVNRSHEGRQGWLVLVRVRRMVVSPFGFLRGSAVVIAADCAGLPATGTTPVICGDSHVGNFGFYDSPERVGLGGLLRDLRLMHTLEVPALRRRQR